MSTTINFPTLDSFFTQEQNTCDICSRTFKSRRSLASHKNHHKEEYRCRDTKIYLANAASTDKAKILSESRQSSYKLNPKKCKNCNQSISYEKKLNQFCDHFCSAKYWNSDSDYTKRKLKGLKKAWEIKSPKKEKIIWGPYSRIYIKNCKISGELFVSKSPSQNIMPKNKLEKEQYYEKCGFKFNVFNYPKEFNLDLISEFGMYSTPGSNKNGINNPDGISRDHKISVNYGFTNNIDPKIISHPANCELMQHKNNKKKHVKNSITLEQLLIDIENWNKKYN